MIPLSRDEMRDGIILMYWNKSRLMIQQNITIFVEVEGRTGVFSWCVIKSFHLPRNVILNDASIFQPVNRDRDPPVRPSR